MALLDRNGQPTRHLRKEVDALSALLAEYDRQMIQPLRAQVTYLSLPFYARWYFDIRLAWVKARMRRKAREQQTAQKVAVPVQTVAVPPEQNGT
jgi:hypothetical protein